MKLLMRGRLALEFGLHTSNSVSSNFCSLIKNVKWQYLAPYLPGMVKHAGQVPYLGKTWAHVLDLEADGVAMFV
jgi:hypothetical protein